MLSEFFGGVWVEGSGIPNLIQGLLAGLLAGLL